MDVKRTGEKKQPRIREKVQRNIKRKNKIKLKEIPEKKTRLEGLRKIVFTIYLKNLDFFSLFSPQNLLKSPRVPKSVQTTCQLIIRLYIDIISF